MTGSGSLDDSPSISSGNASNIDEDSESEYSNSDKNNEEEYDDQPRQLSRTQAPKKGLRTRGGR